jgi:hypothetical protein
MLHGQRFVMLYLPAHEALKSLRRLGVIKALEASASETANNEQGFMLEDKS